MNKKTFRGVIVFVLILVLLMAGAYYFSHNYLVIYPINGDSMEPTVHDGEKVVLFRTQKVKYNDIIVFFMPENSKYLVKRVIGLGGDKIEIKYSESDSLYHVYRNGVILNEDYICEPMEKYTELTVVVPEGKVFFLGDNRLISLDSHLGLMADVSQIQGVAFVKYRSWKDIKFID